MCPQNGLSYSLGAVPDGEDGIGTRKWVHNKIADMMQWIRVKEATAAIMAHYAHRVNGAVVKVYDALVAFGASGACRQLPSVVALRSRGFVVQTTATRAQSGLLIKRAS